MNMNQTIVSLLFNFPAFLEQRKKVGPFPTTGIVELAFEHYSNLNRILMNKPWWIKYGIYDFSAFLLLAPVLRLYFWISVKTVNIHFVKTFNTDDEQVMGLTNFSETAQLRSYVNVPFKNNLEGFSIKHF